MRGVSSITRRGISVASAVILALALIFFLPIPASAYSCPEENLFVKRPNVDSGLGVITTNMARTVTLESGCNYSARFSTAHMFCKSCLFNTFIEIGWQYDGQGMNGFYETEINGVNSTPILFTGPVASISSRYKIIRVDPSLDWKVLFNKNNDGNYALIAQVTMGFGGGWPEGETGRNGSTVSAYDHHSSLYYRDSTGLWHLWTSQILDYDFISNYHYRQITGSEYVVEHD